jgi:hypothetical protein
MLEACKNPDRCVYAIDAQTTAHNAERLVSGVAPRIEHVETEVSGIKADLAEMRNEIRSGNRGTLLAVSIIGGMFTLAASGVALWGQVRASDAGAERGRRAGVAAVESAQPTREAMILEGVAIGSKATIDEQLKRLADNPPPIAKTPDRLGRKLIQPNVAAEVAAPLKFH